METAFVTGTQKYMTPKKEPSTHKVALMIVLVASFIFLSPLFVNIRQLSMDDDWLTVYLHHHFIKDSFQCFRQIPLWSPYVCGGYPIAGYPEFPLVSPVILPTLIFDEIIGPKIVILFFYLLGTLGVFFLARENLRYHPAAAAYAALILAFSSWMPWTAKDGNFIEMHYFLFPALLFLITRFKKNGGEKPLYLFSILLSLVIFDGNVAFLALLLFLFLTVVFDPFREQEKPSEFMLKGAKALAAGVLLAILISMVKIIPMIHLLLYDSRGIDDYGVSSE